LKEIVIDYNGDNGTAIVLPHPHNINKISAYTKVPIKNIGNNLVDFTHCGEISSDVINELSYNKGLVKLDIRSCIPCSVINDNFHNLQSLSIDGRGKMTIKSLNKLKNLKFLSLNKCIVESNCIQDLDLVKLSIDHLNNDLIFNPQKIKYLSVIECPKQTINFKGLINLIRAYLMSTGNVYTINGKLGEQFTFSKN